MVHALEASNEALLVLRTSTANYLKVLNDSVELFLICKAVRVSLLLALFDRVGSLFDVANHGGELARVHCNTIRSLAFSVTGVDDLLELFLSDDSGVAGARSAGE